MYTHSTHTAQAAAAAAQGSGISVLIARWVVVQLLLVMRFKAACLLFQAGLPSVLRTTQPMVAMTNAAQLESQGQTRVLPVDTSSHPSPQCLRHCYRLRGCHALWASSPKDPMKHRRTKVLIGMLQHSKP